MAQGFPQCLLPGKDLGQVGLRMMIHVLAGDVGQAVLRSDVRKVHREREDVTKLGGIRRSRVGQRAALIFPNADRVVALPPGSVVLPIVDERLVRTNRFQ